MEIGISRSNVFKEVERQSAFIGYSASADGSLFNHIYATDDDKQFMYNAWNEGLRVCVQLLYKYIDGELFLHKVSGKDDESIVFDISPSARFNDNLLAGISHSMELMLASNILYRWLVAKVPEIAPSYQPYVEQYSNGIVLLLSHRMTPVRGFSSISGSDTSIDKGTEYFTTSGSDTSIDKGTEYFTTKDLDNIKFEQYAKCNSNN